MPGIRIGIGVDRSRAVAVDWSAYWTTLISATVEQADPADLVLTFTAANLTLVDTDFTVTVNAANRAVSSATWVGNVVTLVLASDVYYEDVVVVTFVKTSETANVTNNITHPLILEEAGTKGWYEYDVLSTITKSEIIGVEYVSEFADMNGTEPSFLQADDARKPIYTVNGLRFNGFGRNMTKTGFNLPCTIYVVYEAISWAQYGSLFGSDSDKLTVVQSADTPNYGMAFWQGGLKGTNNNATLGNEELITIVHNGASSSTQIDDNAAVAASLGVAASLTELILGAMSAAGAYSINAYVKYIVIRDGVSGAAEKAIIQDYFKKKKMMGNNAILTEAEDYYISTEDEWSYLITE